MNAAQRTAAPHVHHEIPADPEVLNFSHLDAIFEVDEGPIASGAPEPVGQVTVFTGGEISALYVGGVLQSTGNRDDMTSEALALLGAHVYTGNEHLLGHADGLPAPDLNTIGVYVETVEKVGTLRAEAEALRAEASYLEDEIGT